MKYSYEEYSKLFHYEKALSDDPDDKNLYDFPVAYDVCLLSSDGDHLCFLAPGHFRNIEDAKDYVAYALAPDAPAKIKTIILDVGYPKTINWEESKRTGYWAFDDWE